MNQTNPTRLQEMLGAEPARLTEQIRGLRLSPADEARLIESGSQSLTHTTCPRCAADNMLCCHAADDDDPHHTVHHFCHVCRETDCNYAVHVSHRVQDGQETEDTTLCPYCRRDTVLS